MSSIECSDDIVFPRVKRKLLQLNEESDETFQLPNEIFVCISSAKAEAVDFAKGCGINLETYDDDFIVADTHSLIETATESYSEEVDDEDENNETIANVVLTEEEIVTLQEDLSQMWLNKCANDGLPMYQASVSEGNRTYKGNHFVQYEGAYIRKSTALYLLQENVQLSNDRLMRVFFY